MMYFFFLLSQEKFPAPQILEYPGWVYTICILLAAIPSLLIPLWAFYQLIKWLNKYLLDIQTKICYNNEGYEVET